MIGILTLLIFKGQLDESVLSFRMQIIKWFERMRRHNPLATVNVLEIRVIHSDQKRYGLSEPGSR